MCLSERPFLYMMLWVASWKFGLAMVVVVLRRTSPLRFLSDLELPGGINQIFKEPPVTSYRKGRSLKDTLAGAKS